MKISSETRTGWIVSVMVHAILLLLFFLISIPQIVQNQDFIEVTWGAPSTAAPAMMKPESAPPISSPAAAPKREASRDKAVTVKKASRPVVLPERRMADPSGDVLPVQKAEKRDVIEAGSVKEKAEVGGVGERDATGRTIGERDQTGPPALPQGSTASPNPGMSGLGGDVEKGVAFSIQWTQGGTRRKISGELPHYPAGVNVEAQIKILTVVLPDGSVKSTQPAQKANTALEEAAMKEVRYWKFEPLRSSQPQNDQTCVVTFLFKLR